LIDDRVIDRLMVESLEVSRPWAQAFNRQSVNRPILRSILNLKFQIIN